MYMEGGGSLTTSLERRTKEFNSRSLYIINLSFENTSIFENILCYYDNRAVTKYNVLALHNVQNTCQVLDYIYSGGINLQP